LQDLLSEPLVQLILAVLRLATRVRDPEAWECLKRELGFLYGLDEAEDARKLDRETERVLQYCRTESVNPNLSIETLINGIMNQIGQSSLKSKYRQYAAGSFQNTIVNQLSETISRARIDTGTLAGAIGDVIGANAVPAMTIHRSKGLEFHTVIFLGLEDYQWRNFATQSDEEKRTFFVAFSRAIHRVMFTFSDWRNGRRGPIRQGRNQINDLYTVLQRAGIQAMNLRGLADGTIRAGIT
jgi:DNA helicase II / ATP-dependent DNA helicase PcrA